MLINEAKVLRRLVFAEQQRLQDMSVRDAVARAKIMLGDPEATLAVYAETLEAMHKTAFGLESNQIRAKVRRTIA